MDYNQMLAQAMMNQPAAPDVDQTAMQMNLMQGQNMLQRADQMRQPINTPYGMHGWGTTLASALRPLIANKQEKKATTKLAEALAQKGQLGQYQQQMESFDAEIQRIKELQDFDRKEKTKAGYKDERTTNQKDLESMGYQAGTPEYNRLMSERSRGVTVKTGDKAPQGYQWSADGKGLEAIPGGPAWLEQQQASQKAEAEAAETERKSALRQAGIEQAGGTVVQDLERALSMLPEMTGGSGVVGANARIAASKVPGTSEYYIHKFVDSAKSNIGLDKLQQMRESSPTGGALGQVPIAQQLRLEKVLGEVDISLTPQMMRDNIQRIQNIYFDIMYGSKAERDLAVEQGRMTPERSAAVDAYHKELSFDKLGRSKSSAPEPSNMSDDDPLGILQ